MTAHAIASRTLGLYREHLQSGIPDIQAQQLAADEAAEESRDYTREVIRQFLSRVDAGRSEAQALEETEELFCGRKTEAIRWSVPEDAPRTADSRSLSESLEAGWGGFEAMTRCVWCGVEHATDEMEHGWCAGCLARVSP